VKSILSLIDRGTFLIVVYAIITLVIAWGTFKAGKDIGYSNGIMTNTNAEYVNGVQDGFEICIEKVIDISKRKYILPPKEEQTL
jgi:hypothetical protein